MSVRCAYIKFLSFWKKKKKKATIVKLLVVESPLYPTLVKSFSSTKENGIMDIRGEEEVLSTLIVVVSFFKGMEPLKIFVPLFLSFCYFFYCLYPCVLILLISMHTYSYAFILTDYVWKRGKFCKPLFTFQDCHLEFTSCRIGLGLYVGWDKIFCLLHSLTEF